jgi:hypothetical protein
MTSPVTLVAIGFGFYDHPSRSFSLDLGKEVFAQQLPADLHHILSLIKRLIQNIHSENFPLLVAAIFFLTLTISISEISILT